MANKERKVNVKEIAKMEIMSIIVKALEDEGITVKSGKDYGMTSGTVIIGHEVCDIQIKPIVPKTGVTRYELAEVE